MLPEAKSFFDQGLRASQSGDLTQAIEAFTCARDLAPDTADIHFKLGVTLFNAGRASEALPAFQRALALEPHRTQALHNIGAVFQALGQSDLARKAFLAVLARDPDSEMAWIGLADTHRSAGNQNEVVKALGKALEINPGNLATRHMLNAATGLSPAQADRAYVEQLFDMYAPRFESHLIEALRYVAPQELAGMLAMLYPEKGRFARVLDLGCGTGLLGSALRALYDCRQIIGVDLSGNMLKAAAARGCYTATVQTDIMEYLRQSQEHFDLIAATDVFIYIGDLAAVFLVCSPRLAVGGVIAFTIEQIEGDGFALRPNGRYGQGRAYVHASAAAAGMRVAREYEAPLRKHAAAPEIGLYVALEKVR